MTRSGRAIAGVLVMAASVAASGQAGQAGTPAPDAQGGRGRGRGNQPPPPAKAAAPIDLTGYWVAVISEDWRWRMLTPAKGDYASLPLNEEGYIGHDWMLPIRGCRLIRAGNEYEFMRAILPTDRISVTWTLEDIVERSRSGGGTQLFVRSVARYRDAAGELVAVNRETVAYQPLA